MKKSQTGSFKNLPKLPMNWTRTFSAALVLCGLAMLLSAVPARAAQIIAIQDGPSPIRYSAVAATFNNSTFTVSSGASVLVVFYGSRTQGGTQPGSDPGTPTISWNGHVMTKAVTQSTTVSTWDDNAIYYLMNPPAGTGSI